MPRRFTKVAWRPVQSGAEITEWAFALLMTVVETVLMKLMARGTWVFLVGLTFGVASASAESFNVSGVRIEGNRRVDTAAMLTQLKHSSGTVTSEQIDEDSKSLYRTGFFDQVTASIVPGGAAGDVLKYAVVEKPMVRKVFLQGNKRIKEDDLRDVLKFTGGRFLDRSKIQSLMRAGVGYYQSQGFYDAAFDYSIVPVGDNQVDVTFLITEGDKVKISEIAFRGLDQVDESDLIDVMQTKRYKWWSSWLLGTGRLHPDMLENDRAIMRQYFLDHGYVDATISDPQVERDGDALRVAFDINEGRQYTVAEITASGDLVNGSVAETIEGIETEVGETFSASQVRDDSFKISEKFTDKGFAFANVVPNTSVNPSEATVSLDFASSKGEPVTVNRINIRGNQKTYDHVIRRELTIGEQELYSSSKVKRSQQLLERLGYFEEANIATVPTEGKDEVNLDVNVREGATGTFSAGAGYSTSDGALFNARLTENNILGTGRSASINADIGTERDNLVLSVNDPRVNDTYWALGMDLLRSDREYDDFDRRLTGGSIEAGYPLDQVFGEWAQDISFSLKYELLQVNIRNVDEDEAAQLVVDSEGTSTSSAISPRFVRNTINNPLNPVRGSRQVLSFEWAGLGGDEEYSLLEARNTLYQPMFDLGFGDFIFSWRAVLGYGESRGDGKFPLFRRYFPGGINSVRGFKNRTLGPRDQNGRRFGGSKELVTNFEMIFPLINSAGLRGVVFYDLGEAFDDDERIEFGDLRRAYGGGIRWQSPLGPIRVEFGFPINREEGESNMVTLFSFGAPF